MREPERFTSRAMSGASGAGRIFLGVLNTLHDTAGDLVEGTAAGVSDALVDLLGASIASVSEARVKLPSNLEQYHRERVRNAVRERVGLAGTGSRDHEQRAGAEAFGRAGAEDGGAPLRRI